VKKKNVERATPQLTTWRLRISCWVTKATDTLAIRNTAFPLQRWLHERASVLRYAFIACHVMNFISLA
jgi:hypothetical protein